MPSFGDRMKQKAVAKGGLFKADGKPEQTGLESEMAKSPKACVEMISADFQRIKAWHIDKGNFAEASNGLKNSIYMADYEHFRSYIKGGVHMGVLFIVELELVIRSLDEGDKDAVEGHARKLLVYIKQRELREACLRRMAPAQ
jgi:hypothetical protein